MGQERAHRSRTLGTKRYLTICMASAGLTSVATARHEMSYLSPLISPSKARHAASQAKDWAYVLAWLTKMYRPEPVPRFERSPEVLKELLALVAANATADEEAELLHRLREEELRRAGGGRGQAAERDSLFQELLDEIEASLDLPGEESLEQLAETKVVLGTLSTDQVTLGTRIVEITKEEFDAADQMRRIDGMQSYLQKEMERLRAAMASLRDQENQIPAEEMQQRTVLWNRETKLIVVKLGEYRERVAGLERQKPAGPTIEEVRADENEVSRRQARVKAMENQIAGYHGLPPDLDAARAEYRRTQGELQSLVRRRDELFDAMMST